MFLRILLYFFIAGSFVCCKKDAESPANQSPVVSIDWGNQTNNISVKASYNDPDGTITALKFFIYKDGQLWQSNTISGVPSSPVEYSNVMSIHESAGTYTIYLDVTDNKNATTRSNVLTIKF